MATAKLNDLEPAAWLKDTLEKLPSWPNSRIDELLLLARSDSVKVVGLDAYGVLSFGGCPRFVRSVGVPALCAALRAALRAVASSPLCVAPKRDAVIFGRYVVSSLSGLRARVKAGASHAAAREIAQGILLALRGGFGLS